MAQLKLFDLPQDGGGENADSEILRLIREARCAVRAHPLHWARGVAFVRKCKACGKQVHEHDLIAVMNEGGWVDNNWNPLFMRWAVREVHAEAVFNPRKSRFDLVNIGTAHRE